MAKTKVDKIEIEEIERPYTLRALKDGDLFPLINIIKEIGIDEFQDAIETLKKSYVNSEGNADITKAVGAEVVFSVAKTFINNVPKVETRLYELWGDISGIAPEDIKEMEFGTLPLMIMDTFKEAGNASFFKVLSRFLR